MSAPRAGIAPFWVAGQCGVNNHKGDARRNGGPRVFPGVTAVRAIQVNPAHVLFSHINEQAKVDFNRIYSFYCIYQNNWPQRQHIYFFRPFPLLAVVGAFAAVALLFLSTTALAPAIKQLTALLLMRLAPSALLPASDASASPPFSGSAS